MAGRLSTRLSTRRLSTRLSTLPKVLCPVLTPFSLNTNNVYQPNAQKLLRQCQWLQSNGVGQAVFGTNSEANSMSVQQKVHLLEELVSGGLNPHFMMPGTGACSIDDSVVLSLKAAQLKCAGVLMLPPFYYKDVSDDGLFAYFSEVIQQVGLSSLQVYIYNIPQVTKVNISLTLLDRLITAYPNTVVGMKDSAAGMGCTLTQKFINILGSCRPINQHFYPLFQTGHTRHLPSKHSAPETFGYMRAVNLSCCERYVLVESVASRRLPT